MHFLKPGRKVTGFGRVIKNKMYILISLSRLKAQVFLEFTLAFTCMIIFLLATTAIFVWAGKHIVDRHVAYEQTRRFAGNGTTTNANINFYDKSQAPLDIFNDWIN